VLGHLSDQTQPAHRKHQQVIKGTCANNATAFAPKVGLPTSALYTHSSEFAQQLLQMLQAGALPKPATSAFALG
jgi:hypothetical protein